MIDETRSPTPPDLWTGQGLHAISLAVLFALVWATWIYLGKPYPLAFWTAVAFPIAHQVYVWLAWRLELASGGPPRQTLCGRPLASRRSWLRLRSQTGNR